MNEINEETIYCHWHPDTETALRCYACNKPMCVKCAQRTPVGYICRDCKKGRKQRYEQAKTSDLVIAGGTALVLGAISSIIPLWGYRLSWIMLLASLLAGNIIANVIWELVKHRYSEHLRWIAAAGIVVGCLPAVLFSGFSVMIGNSGLTVPVLTLLHIPLVIINIAARLRLR